MSTVLYVILYKLPFQHKLLVKDPYCANIEISLVRSCESIHTGLETKYVQISLFPYLRIKQSFKIENHAFGNTWWQSLLSYAGKGSMDYRS